MAPIKKRSYFLRWLAYVRKHTPYLVLAIACLLVGMGIDVVLPKAIGFIIDRMLKPDVIAAGRVDLYALHGLPLKQAFMVILSVLVVLLLVRAICNYSRNMLLTYAGEQVHLDVRQGLFDHLHRLPISYFDQSHTGKLMARLTTDTDALWHLLYNGTIDVFGNCLMILVVLGILLNMDPALSLFCLAVVPVLAYITWRTRARARDASRSQREAVANIYTSLQEKITGIRLIRAFGRRKDEAKNFSEELRGLYKCNMHLNATYTMLGIRSDFLTRTTLMAILCLGGMIVAGGRLSVGELVSFYLYAGMLLSPLGNIIGSMTQYVTNAHIAMERIFELMDTPVAAELSGPNLPAPRFAGSVSMRNVTFAYGAETVMRGLSFEAPAGSTVALVGPSGSGKTTIVNLICRFYYPQAGALFVDDKDIADFEVESYRSRISYVTQEPIFFSGPIRQNMLYAKPDASTDELVAALRKTHSFEFVMKLPKGLDTEIGERGVTLSGGQRQRLSIARALLRDPAIVILDEPTSALDAESESIVLEAVEEIFLDRTCFIIAHRLSTIRSADVIFVLDKGVIVQKGTHRVLVDAPGIYREFYTKQMMALSEPTPAGEDEAPEA